MRPSLAADNSAFIFVPNVEVRMEAQHSCPHLSLYDLREFSALSFYINESSVIERSYLTT
jgi:hypothetical protein